jgi:hypothetical protein
MGTDNAVLAEIDAAFAGVERPEHFTDYTHCAECAEHDALLRARTRETLGIADVGNPGWDPLAFCSPAGIAYYFPALARLALAGPNPVDDSWYADQLLFHLHYGQAENAFFQFCTPPQRRAVARLLAHLSATRTSLIDRNASADEFLQCRQLWGDAPASGALPD